MSLWIVNIPLAVAAAKPFNSGDKISLPTLLIISTKQAKISEPGKHRDPKIVENQVALSSIWRHIPHVLLTGKELAVGVRVFLDRSGQSKYVTLAAFAGPDLAWAAFESGWKETLKTGFLPVDYFHVREALAFEPKSPFSWKLGWKKKHIWDLLGKLIAYIGQFSKGQLTMHYCIVHMDAWRELTSQGVSIPSEIELCNKYVCQVVTAMFADKVMREAPEGSVINLYTDELLNFVFDRDEPFFEPFRTFVSEEKKEIEGSGVSSIFQLIDGVGEGEMKRTPGLQAADIFAWGINRENAVNEGEAGKYIAHILRQVVMFTGKEYDYVTLSKEFGPPSSNAYH